MTRKKDHDHDHLLSWGRGVSLPPVPLATIYGF